ncbi:DMT family transporter [Tropicimonas aquimaris]|uniref:DMT family transporter n=1 Tax=Tropicimonas aquimaris TaxID=914152 RepID=A0ABW3IKJ8_9RHOB
MHNLRGAILMILSMGFFALEDMFIKRTTETLPIGQIMMVSGLCGFALFSIVVALLRQSLFPAELLAPAVMLRNGSELLAALSFFTALSIIPLSSAAAILQAAPLAVTLLAAVALGETVGPRRWMAVGIGFVGVLMIVRPGTGAFEPAALLAVFSVLALAVRDVATRVVPASLSSMQITQWSFGIFVPAGAILLLFGPGLQPMDAATSLTFVWIVGCGAVGYYAMVMALRMASLSVIAPFRYSRLLFALAIGMAVLGERPDTLTLAGACLIIASGLYTLARERALFSEA